MYSIHVHYHIRSYPNYEPASLSTYNEPLKTYKGTSVQYQHVPHLIVVLSHTVEAQLEVGKAVVSMFQPL